MAGARLITIEGLDGAGKTTVSAALRDSLAARGIDVRLLREPGGVRVAERIRSLLKDPELRLAPRAEALLFAAARAQLVQEAIEPLLSAGTWVLLDRFVDSSLAYQGAGRGLGMGAIREINDFAIGEVFVDRTLLLLVEPSLGMARSSQRADGRDRLEEEDDAFRDRVAAGYLELAAADPHRIRTIDAGQDPEQVLADALAALEDLV
jgi:dTMP kinase